MEIDVEENEQPIITTTLGELLEEFYSINEDRDPCHVAIDPSIGKTDIKIWPEDHVWVAIYRGNYWVKIVQGHKNDPHKAFLYYETPHRIRWQIATATLSFFFFSQSKMQEQLNDLLYNKEWLQSEYTANREVEVY